MKTFDELEARYSGIISHALYEKRCFTIMKHEFLKLE